MSERVKLTDKGLAYVQWRGQSEDDYIIPFVAFGAGWDAAAPASTDPASLLLTFDQQADDPHADPVVEALAVRLYESDPESAFNDGDDVQWRDNYADRDQYRGLARVAIDFLGGVR